MKNSLAIKIHRIINSFYSSNTYILFNEASYAYIIDCGDSELIIKWLRDNNKILSGVLLTHTHFDHIYGLNDLLKKHRDFTIYTNLFGKKALFNSRKNLSLYHESEFIYQGNKISLLDDIDIITLWDFLKIKICKTPGHDKSCLTYSIGDYLFTGDSYIPAHKVVTILPKSDKLESKTSEKIIRSMIFPDTIVCPGHGEMCIGLN